MKVIDISIPISPNIPIWPKTPKPKFSMISSIKDGDSANDTKIEMSVHTGTHIEVSSHFLTKGKLINQIDPNVFIGQVLVVYLPEVKKITSQNIEELKIPKKISRLLFKTSNSSLWKKNVKLFKKNYVGLTVDAAETLTKKGLKLVGIDYLSIANFYETVTVHQVLMKKEVVILEGLDLSKVKPGVYQLMAMPVLMIGTEASPVRAVLVKK